MASDDKPTLVLDFDGVLHSYTSGWQEATVIADPPVEGFAQFLIEAVASFTVAISSSRSHEEGGRAAMREWLFEQLLEHSALTPKEATLLVAAIQFPKHKPPAFVTLDDRALTFTGHWPAIADLLAFRPWNKR